MATESNVRSDPRGTPPRSGLDAFFHISERGSTIEREIRGGLATFFTMAYIVVLNPLILGGAQDVNGQRLDLRQLTTATALVAAAMTLLMGVYGRYPFAIAAGLGLNAVVAFQLAAVMSWPAAMGIVVLEGLVITLLVLTGLREWVMNVIPLALKVPRPSR
jgi:AGZA family xanthine/uracil permease-like MFS transporter